MAGTRKIRFGTGTTVQGFRVRMASGLRVAEDCGYELLTTGDSQSLWADPFVIDDGRGRAHDAAAARASPSPTR